MCGLKFCSMNYSSKVDEYNKQVHGAEKKTTRTGGEAGQPEVAADHVGTAAPEPGLSEAEHFLRWRFLRPVVPNCRALLGWTAEAAVLTRFGEPLLLEVRNPSQTN
jgi:hypothetical protein